MPTDFAPWMSSNGRSPTNTAARRLATPTASSAARNASGCGLVHGISELYTAPSMRSSTPSRAKIRSCSARDQIVFDSTPILSPRSCSASNSAGDLAGRGRCAAPTSRGTRRACPRCRRDPGRGEDLGQGCRCGARRASATQISLLGGQQPVARVSSSPTAAIHAARGSMVCHGVSVPPQSKITACRSRIAACDPRRTPRASEQHGRQRRDLVACPASRTCAGAATLKSLT